MPDGVGFGSDSVWFSNPEEWEADCGPDYKAAWEDLARHSQREGEQLHALSARAKALIDAWDEFDGDGNPDSVAPFVEDLRACVTE